MSKKRWLVFVENGKSVRVVYSLLKLRAVIRSLQNLNSTNGCVDYSMNIPSKDYRFLH